MKSGVAFHLFAALIAATAISCSRHHEPESYRETDGITLDADVPGTQVFLAAKQLGTVPVTLSAKTLASFGVPNPRMDTNLVFNSDGFGETVFILKDGTNYTRFTFLVPERVRADYVAMETPWGLRTKHFESSYEPGRSIQVHCARVIRHDGLSLTLEPIHAVSDGREPWKLKLTLVNHGSQAVAGFRPSIMICRSALCPPWIRRGPNEITLSKEWASIGPGQSLETETSIDPPDTNGNYGIYVIFSLFKDPTSNYLAGDGWCYSNTKLLSVK